MTGQERGRNSYDFIFILMLGHFSSMEDRQRFVEGKPYEPIAESTLVIKCRDMASG